MTHQSLDQLSLFQENVIEVYLYFEEWFQGSVLANIFGYGGFECVSWIDVFVICIFLGVMISVRRKQNAREMKRWLQAKKQHVQREVPPQLEIPFRLPPGFELATFLVEITRYYTYLYTETCNPLPLVGAALREKFAHCVPQHFKMRIDQPHFRVLSANHNHHSAKLRVQCASCAVTKMDEVWSVERDLLTPESLWVVVDIQFIAQASRMPTDHSPHKVTTLP